MDLVEPSFCKIWKNKKEPGRHSCLPACLPPCLPVYLFVFCQLSTVSRSHVIVLFRLFVYSQQAIFEGKWPKLFLMRILTFFFKKKNQHIFRGINQIERSHGTLIRMQTSYQVEQLILSWIDHCDFLYLNIHTRKEELFYLDGSGNAYQLAKACLNKIIVKD